MAGQPWRTSTSRCGAVGKVSKVINISHQWKCKCNTNCLRQKERESEKEESGKEEERESVGAVRCLFAVRILFGHYFSDWPHVLPSPCRVWRAGSLKCAAILRKWKITQPREQSTQRKQDGEPKKNKANWEFKLADYGIHCQMERGLCRHCLKEFS